MQIFRPIKKYEARLTDYEKECFEKVSTILHNWLDDLKEHQCYQISTFEEGEVYEYEFDEISTLAETLEHLKYTDSIS